MRLLSFVPCGCRAGPIDDAPPAHLDGAVAAAGRRRRRRSSIRSSPLGADQWRPSLGDICEEYSADAKAGGGRRVAPARLADSASAWDVARVLPRAHSDEYRYAPGECVVDAGVRADGVPVLIVAAAASPSTGRR
ncbi:hypothetical protein ACP4OV_018220 [Aristida adscensionis]